MIYIQYDSDLPTWKELRFELIKEAIHKNKTMEEASEEIGLSIRSMYRIINKFGGDMKAIRNGLE